MTDPYGFWEALGLVGAVHGFFLAIVLWTLPRGNRSANRLLAPLVALYSIHLLHIVLYWTRELDALVHFWGTPWLFPYLYGPLLYFYVRALTEPRFRLAPRSAAHAVPFALAVLAFSRFYLLDAELKRRLLEASYLSTTQGSNPFVLAVWSLQFVHFTCYFVASLGRVGAAPTAAELRWARRLLVAFASSFSCWFAYGVAVSLGVAYSRAIDVAATMAMTVSIYGVGYTALREPEVFVGELRRPRGKYESSPLSGGELSELRGRLVDLMTRERPYRNVDLRLADLAGLVGVTPHELSQILNQGFGERFNDFVNRYRVEDAKRLLRDPGLRGESLLKLAYEAGFNNKTSFNQAFKKQTRMTPSRYRAINGSDDGEKRQLL